MATKYELITERYLNTAGEIAKPEVWPFFLTTACHNFRLSFDKQVLLFAQRPDATAVLPIEGKHGWNQKFGRWVNRGSKGIALFDSDRNGVATLKYYFDISDTHEGRYPRPVPIWSVKPEYEQDILETLENSFGDLEKKDSLASGLISVAQNVVELLLLDAVEIREKLAQRGIVDGQLVDPEVLDNDPFIQQVVANAKAMEQEQPAVLVPPQAKPKREHITFEPLYPGIPKEQRNNFRITDPDLGHGSAGQKYAANVAAIRMLKRIEDEGRLATPVEQEILSRYVGWGGLADCFDEKHHKYPELKALLSEEEFADARASSLTAFYTSPVIIQAMYQALKNMGFKEGNILEPSCGVGNFLGMIPDSMAGSKTYGVELDSISGRIAQQLYQNSSIAITGFEKVQMPDSFFDVAIGNVPFGDFKVLDKRYDKHHWLIHDYFFGKTLDKVRPGGIVAFITSKGTLDKENSAVRKYLAQRADLIGAIRLPNDAFKRNAGTEVTSDILFLQKRDRMTDIEPDWVHLDTDPNGIRMNSYFVQHPEMILGEMVMDSTRFGMDSTCKPYPEKDLGWQLAEAVSTLNAQITDYQHEELEEDDRSIPADPNVRNFSYTIVDGKVYFRENSRMNPVEVSVTAENRIRGMIHLRDCVRKLIDYQTEGYPDEDIQREQRNLNDLYDDYTKKYGLLCSRGNSLAFSDDSSYFLLCSLEVLDEEGNFKRNCDEFLYLGGNETGTHKMIAESYLGKETIDMNTYGKSSGRSGNYSTNWQITGRELLDAAEVRMLDNRYALLFIRGEMPVIEFNRLLKQHKDILKVFLLDGDSYKAELTLLNSLRNNETHFYIGRDDYLNESEFLQLYNFMTTFYHVMHEYELLTMVWSYIGELIFNMLILVGTVKMADRVVREMMGL